jgi:hypothetical protein
MHEHDRATVAVKEGVSVREVAHHFAGLLPHERFVLTHLQRVVDGLADIPGVREQHRALLDEKMGRVGEPVLACPGKNAFEEGFMRMEEVAISQCGLAFEMR